MLTQIHLHNTRGFTERRARSNNVSLQVLTYSTNSPHSPSIPQAECACVGLSCRDRALIETVLTNVVTNDFSPINSSGQQLFRVLGSLGNRPLVARDVCSFLCFYHHLPPMASPDLSPDCLCFRTRTSHTQPDPIFPCLSLMSVLAFW